MKTEYRRDLQHSYLVLHPEEPMDEDAYQLKMILQNRIPGLLACESRRIDDEILYYYDLTSRISLTEKCCARKVTGEEVIIIVCRLLEILIRMEEYLLSGDSLCLKPENIYLDAQMKEVSFCYVPGEKWNLEEQFRELMEGLLPFLDHQKQEGVMAVYGLYHYAVQEHFSVDGLKEQLEQYHREKEKQEQKSDNGEKRGVIAEEARELEVKERETMERRRHEEALNAFFQDEEEERRTNPAAVTLGTVFLILYLLSGWFLWRNFPAYLWIWSGCGVLAGVGMIFRYRKSKGLLQVQEKAVKTEKEAIEIKETGNEIGKETAAENVIETGAVRNESDHRRGETSVLWENRPETQVLGKMEGTTIGKTIYILREEYPEPGRQVVLSEKEVQLLGSVRGNADLLLSSPAVSRLHARFKRNGETYGLCDLNSKNGTWVNGQQLQGAQEVVLKVGDEIKFADMKYVFLSL
ncbi:MAG: FHA domain-containing protein [Clostridiales bacterium]|nr:FHA domain-containing protein [Clostridiales bacterium]